MFTFNHHAVAGAARRTLPLAALGLLAGLAFGTGTASPATAQTSWEEGCAAPVVQPGYGDALRVMNCMRQKDCQRIVNSGGQAAGLAAGCFGVAPSAPQAPAGAVAPRQRHQ